MQGDFFDFSSSFIQSFAVGEDSFCGRWGEAETENDPVDCFPAELLRTQACFAYIGTTKSKISVPEVRPSEFAKGKARETATACVARLVPLGKPVGSSLPHKNRTRKIRVLFLCGRWDLNPHVIAHTRSLEGFEMLSRRSCWWFSHYYALRFSDIFRLFYLVSLLFHFAIALTGYY